MTERLPRPRIPKRADRAADVPASSADDARTGRWERIYAVVRRIPRGKVASYGQVAALAGLPGHARQVGYALHALRDEGGVPWHRVVNAQGRLSLGRDVAGGQIPQRFRLEAEGVEFHPNGSILLARYGWKPRRKPPAAVSPDAEGAEGDRDGG